MPPKRKAEFLEESLPANKRKYYRYLNKQLRTAKAVALRATNALRDANDEYEAFMADYTLPTIEELFESDSE